MTSKNENSDADKEVHLNSNKNFKPSKTEDWGYFFYPERFGSVYKPSWFEKLFSFTGTTDTVNRATCEKNVQNAIETHPGVKLLLSAMKNVGCEANLLRHFSCERCDGYVKGGFDPSTNQVIICYNTVSKFNDDVAKSMINSLLEAYDYCRANYNTQSLTHLACSKIIICHNRVHTASDCEEILSHELVHAFDYCRAHIDITNNFHVACTEIRAANLTQCSYMETFKNSLFKIDNSRKSCVREKAALSLQTVRNITEEEALKVVDSVFERCYNDLEPFGRRIYDREDCDRAYQDRHRFKI